jgi:hypothetical protein
MMTRALIGGCLLAVLALRPGVALTQEASWAAGRVGVHRRPPPSSPAGESDVADGGWGSQVARKTRQRLADSAKHENALAC